MKKRIMSALLAGVMVFGLSACNGNEAPKDTTKSDTTATEGTTMPGDVANTGEKILRMGVNGEPPDLDPQKSTDAVSAEIITSMLEGLIRIHDGKIQPGMAESWDISPDSLTYTFHLRDAKWNDGVPVTAKDFEYSIKRLLDPAEAAQYAYQAYYIKGGKAWNTGEGKVEDVGVKAIDDKTLEIVLEYPTKYFLSLLQLAQYLPVRQDIVEKHDKKFAADADKFVYNGPFIMTEWKHDEEVILVKNEDYWDKDNIKLSKVELSVLAKRQPELQMYQDNQLDYALLDRDTMAQVEQSELKYYSDGAVEYYQINTVNDDPVKSKLLNNKNFRKALGFSLDRKSYCESVLKGGSEPAARFILPLFAGNSEDKKFNEEYPLNFYPESPDINKAKEFLNTALTEEGLTIDQIPTIQYLTDDTESAKIQAEAMQAMVKEIGVKFDIKQVPFKQRLELMTNGDFDIVGALWGPDYDDPMTYMDLWVTGGGNNHGKWSNKDYDKLISDSAIEADAVKRGQMILDAEKLLLDESPIIPIQFRKRPYAIQPYVSNLIHNFYGALRDFIYVDIDLAKKAEILGK